MCTCSSQIRAIPLVVGQIGSPQKLISSAANGYTFAYAPSMIQVGDTYHTYYCSSGVSDTAWDYIRHSTTKDWKVWTPPSTLLIPSDPVNERSCCDPTTVRFNAGDGDFYYMLYSGNKLNVQTVNFVARCLTPDGVFAKYTNRGTWEVNPPDPKIIHFPFNAAPEGSNVYGRGQPTLVVKGDLLYVWFSDNTARYPTDFTGLVYMATSKNVVDWSDPIPTGVAAWSVDVKYDVVASRFIMFSGEEHHGAAPKMMSRVSDEGIHWSTPTVLFNMPPYSHNIGVSGGERGEYQPAKMLFAYGAPVNLVNSLSRANWDLYGQIQGDTSAYKKMTTAQASESIPSLPVSNVVDGDTNTFYSSLNFTSKFADRGLFLAAWFDGKKQTTSRIVIRARMTGSVVMCFPEKYTLYVHLVGTGYWTSLGEFTDQPNGVGDVSIDIGQREIYGVQIVPTVLGTDNNNNCYFQLSEIGAIVG